MLEEHGDFLKEAVAESRRSANGRGDLRPRSARLRGEVCVGLALDVPQRVPAARPWETRVGEIELADPAQALGGGVLPVVSGASAGCAEQAILVVVMEAYVNGVSTRKVDRLVEQLEIHGMTKDRVSCDLPGAG